LRCVHQQSANLWDQSDGFPDGIGVQEDRPFLEVVPFATMETGLYRVPLAVALSDSTHGTITHFELITVNPSFATGGPNRE